MKQVDCVVIGGGPAGLLATSMLIESGVNVLLIDRQNQLGGQLIKQTHKFFGNEKQFARMRGFDIARKLSEKIENHPLCEIWKNTAVVSLYHDLIVGTYDQTQYQEVKAKKIILATGASEKYLAFENNDLPQIMGAGAIQTLMNVYGVKPAKEVVMIGSGNIGLIVSYQLLQAGIQVKAVVEASDKVGGYQVHANKLIRHGVPILLNHTINRAIGTDYLEALELVNLNDGTKSVIETDTCCIAVGLSPAHQLASMLKVKTAYIASLGGEVIIVNDFYQSSLPDLYVVGDALGIEEASAAMMEGAIGGLIVGSHLNNPHPQFETLIRDFQTQLESLRSGPFGHKTRVGFELMKEEQEYVF